MRRERLAWVAVTGAAIALLIWVATHTYWAEVKVPMPPKGEAVTNPFYVVERFAQALGARAEWNRGLTLPPPNGVVFISAWDWDLTSDRRQRIEQWVQSGGRLVVDKSLINSTDSFEKWSGIGQEATETHQRRAVPRRQAAARCYTLDENGDSQDRYSVCGMDATSKLKTTRRASWTLGRVPWGLQAVRVTVGRGSVTLINGLLFGNPQLLCGEGGLLFTAATQLHRGDDVEFLTDGTGGSLLALLWSYGWPVIVLAGLLIVLWLWRSGVRFGPLVAAADPARRSLAEQIRGTGQFIVRFGGGKALYAATARALNEAASRRVPRYERLNGEERVTALASLTGLGSAELSAALDDPAARRPKEIRKTIAFLEAARRRIAHTR